MIQRIQTVFLLLASIADFSTLALPFASTGELVQSSSLFSDKIYSVGDNIGLLVLFAVAGALSLAAIFLYNNRPLQLRIGQVALLSNIIGIVLTVVLFWQDKSNVSGESIHSGVGGFLPLAFIVFSMLAIRGIRRDEKLVRSADRLR